MEEIKLTKRYPHSRTEDITDAFMRGYQQGKHEVLQKFSGMILDIMTTADRKTENSSEIPNNCKPQYDIDKGTIKCDNCSENGSYKCTKCDGEMYFKRLEVEDEPQTEKHKCRRCLFYDISSDCYPCSECVDYSNYSGEIEDEPQTDCAWR